MLGVYNTNFNNMYVNQNYGYQQPVMNNNYQSQSIFGGYNYSNQQSSYGNNSTNLMSMMMMLLQGLLGQNATSVGNTYSNSGVNIVNNGNIGSINIANLFTGLLGNGTTTIDQTQVSVEEKNPEKVYIIGAYNTGKNLTLEDNIKDFYNSGSTQRSTKGGNNDYYKGSNWHNNITDNDEGLKDLLGNLSEEDKKLTFDKGEAYVITESGKVLGKISSSQAATEQSFYKSADTDNTPTALKNSSFRILNDLGMADKALTGSNLDSLIKKYGTEEATGGKIELNGKTYDVASTVVRKVTPLTFDLNGDGVKTSDKVVDYDIDGDGKKDKINDVADGTLCIRGGKDGKDLFGDNTDLDGDGKADGFKDGFAALKALAKKEGLINGKDDMVLDAKDIKILEEKYDFGMKTDGYNSKAKSLEELGITEINLASTDETTSQDNFDGQGNLLMEQEGATFKLNGEDREYADIWHEFK